MGSPLGMRALVIQRHSKKSCRKKRMQYSSPIKTKIPLSAVSGTSVPSTQKKMNYRIFALTLLLDAVDDITGRDRSKTEKVYKDTTQGEGKRLKENALDFFFSQESEPYCLFWCDIADQSILRFRRELREYNNFQIIR